MEVFEVLFFAQLPKIGLHRHPRELARQSCSVVIVPQNCGCCVGTEVGILEGGAIGFNVDGWFVGGHVGLLLVGASVGRFTASYLIFPLNKRGVYITPDAPGPGNLLLAMPEPNIN